MKTLQQRLQSRISLRRNHIRMLEDSLAEVKAERQRLYAKLDLAPMQTDEFDATLENVLFLRQVERDGREVIKTVAQDQKLDKELHHLVQFGWYPYAGALYDIG